MMSGAKVGRIGVVHAGGAAGIAAVAVKLLEVVGRGGNIRGLDHGTGQSLLRIFDRNAERPVVGRVRDHAKCRLGEPKSGPTGSSCPFPGRRRGRRAGRTSPLRLGVRKLQDCPPKTSNLAALVVHPVEAHPKGIAVARIVGVGWLIAQEVGLEVTSHVSLAKLGVGSQTDARVLC